MGEEFKKYMISMSLEETPPGRIIRLQKEPFYKNQDRWVCSILNIDSSDKKILMRSKDIKFDLGFRLTNHLFKRDDDCQWKRQKGCLVVFPNARNSQICLAIGIQVFDFEKPKEHCIDIDIGKNGRSDLLKDEGFMTILAENILKHLPISEELCLLDPT